LRRNRFILSYRANEISEKLFKEGLPELWSFTDAWTFLGVFENVFVVSWVPKLEGIESADRQKEA